MTNFYCGIMIENKKLGEIAEIFAGARLSRFDSGITKKQKVLKRTQEEYSFGRLRRKGLLY